jgi:5'-nucleotidase (lipoprotein e(P4) family)
VSSPRPCPTTPQNPEYQIGATLWVQKAAEYKALAYQAFNIAEMRLGEDLKNRKKLPKTERKMKGAVVVDIDETMLDNSPQQASSIKRDLEYCEKRFQEEWIDKHDAEAIPGAVDFSKKAIAMGYAVFYISNRYDTQKEQTIRSLNKAGFAGVSSDTVMLRVAESGKMRRRQAVKDKNYRIAMLIGDNLDDFSEIFEIDSLKNSLAAANDTQTTLANKRFQVTEANRANFGAKFIVLPNPVYGTWEVLLNQEPANQQYKKEDGKTLDTKKIRDASLVSPIQ